MVIKSVWSILLAEAIKYQEPNKRKLVSIV